MPTDLEIAQAAQPKRIQEIAEKAGIPEGAISPYGQYIAKVDPMQLGDRFRRLGGRHDENRQTGDAGAARTVTRPGVRHEGRRGRRRQGAGAADGAD